MTMDEPANKRPRGDDNKNHRFLINNTIAGIVIGKGGESIKNIREECGVGINIMKADGVEDRVMVIKGDADNAAKAFGMVLQGIVASNEKSGGLNSTDARVLVHSMHCGAIIGKGGATIKETMANTGCAIKISNEPLPGSTEKVCDISGSPSQIEAGLHTVLSQLQENPLNPGAQTMNYLAQPSHGNAPASTPHSYMHDSLPDPYSAYSAPAQFGNFGTVPAVHAPVAHPSHGHAHSSGEFDTSGAPSQTEIAVPSAACGAVIGKGGQTVKYINATSGCSINLSARAEGDENRKIMIKGPSNGISVAIFLIRQAIEVQSGASGALKLDTEQKTHTLKIESAKAGLLIGKGGQTVQEIKKYSGCNIVNINTATEDDPTHRVVSIKGTPFHVQCALTIIEHKLSEPSGNGVSHHSAPSTLTHLSQYNNQYAGQPEGETTTVQVAIPTSMAGAVIGKGGSVVKDLKAATGCSVVIAAPTSDNPDERIVTITGNRTNYAVSLIQGLVTPQ